MQTLPQGSVLGTTDFGPVGGTPLIPPSYLTLYFVLFLIVLTGIYFYFYKKRKPLLFRHQLKLLVLIALSIKIIAVSGIIFLLGYWLVPTPGIRRTIPKDFSSSFPPTNKIEIVFDRPVSRGELEKSITPETPGRWVFENSVYTTHLYRNLVFYPTFSLNPDTTYTIKLSHIQNLIKSSPLYEYQFQFTTQPSPKVKKVIPENDQVDVSLDSEIKVYLDNPNDSVSEFNFSLDPETAFTTALDSTKTIYTIKPQDLLKHGTKYNLKVTKSDVIINLEDATVSERSQTTAEHISSFKTFESPGIISFAPDQNNALTNSDIKIQFSHDMDKKSVQENFYIDPKVPGNFSWEGNSKLTFNPTSLSPDTEYRVTVVKGTKSISAGNLEEDLIKTFRTIGPVKVASFTPKNGLTAVNIHSPIKIAFDQEVDQKSAESKFFIEPKVDGQFSWTDNTLSFSPSSSLSFSTNYSVGINEDVKSVDGTNSKQKFQSQFSTQNTSIKLNVPAYLQKYTLSCEIASLRMALNYRGKNVSEDDLIPKVGQDPTPHNGNVWGNPYKAFVGNIRGTQMKDGYGVHWGPIANAARAYTGAKDFERWNIEQLTSELTNNNPVVIWVYSHFGTKTTWNTPQGESIYAVRDEHAVVAVGFVGPANNPSQIIINDPLIGQVYWSRSSFDKKWGIFNNSGVVIY